MSWLLKFHQLFQYVQFAVFFHCLIFCRVVLSSLICSLTFDHIYDPGETFLKAQIRETRSFLYPDFATLITLTGKSQLIAYLRVCQGPINVLFVREDENRNLCIGSLCHNLVQSVTHITHRLRIRRIYHEDDPIDSLIVVLPGTAELKLTGKIPNFDTDITHLDFF